MCCCEGDATLFDCEALISSPVFELGSGLSFLNAPSENKDMTVNLSIGPY